MGQDDQRPGSKTRPLIGFELTERLKILGSKP